jgi:hypothetical protein
LVDTTMDYTTCQRALMGRLPDDLAVEIELLSFPLENKINPKRRVDERQYLEKIARCAAVLRHLWRALRANYFLGWRG